MAVDCLVQASDVESYNNVRRQPCSAFDATVKGQCNGSSAGATAAILVTLERTFPARWSLAYIGRISSDVSWRAY